MRISTREFDASAYQQIRAFLSLRPTPQVNHWETLARKFREHGDVHAAYFILDKLASVYGKDVARAAIERFTQLPLFMRGRGAPIDATEQTHPARYFLRDGLRPILSGNQLLLRVGSNVLALDPRSPSSRAFHIFDDIPTQTGFAGMGNVQRPIEWAPYGDGFVYFKPACEQTIDSSDDENEKHANRLYYVDLRQIDRSLPLEIANKVRIRISYIEFDTNIRHIAEPLSDGTLFVVVSSPIAVLSDICRLVRFNLGKLRAVLDDDFESEIVDLRQYGAVESDIVMTNVEQSLCNDCIANGDVYLTCRGGMQNRELRFIAPDGSWRTKFLHDAPVRAVVKTPSGAVSIDESGRAFLFQNQNPIDDCAFAIEKLPDDIRGELQQNLLSIDWENKKFYLTKKTKFHKIDDILDNLQSYCVTTDSIAKDYVVQTPNQRDPSLVLLRDGSYHFWSDATHSIDFAWQISKETALADDWNDILSTKNSPNVEDDPRVRWYAN